MHLDWTSVALLALLLLLNIISFVTLLVQKETAQQQKKTEIISVRGSVMTPNEMRRSMHIDVQPPSPMLLDRGRRLIWNGRDYHRLQWGQVIAKQHGNSLFVYDPDGAEQEYVKPCGSFVTGGFGQPWRSTFCVLPDGHCGNKHIDMDGNKKKVGRDCDGRD